MCFTETSLGCVLSAGGLCHPWLWAAEWFAQGSFLTSMMGLIGMHLGLPCGKLFCSSPDLQAGGAKSSP
eukprot:s221_g18.t1